MSTSHFEREAGPVADRLKMGLLRLSLGLRAETRRASDPQGLTPLQAQILSLLDRATGPLRLAQLALGLGVRPATASEAVSTLVGKRLVRKSTARDDARAVSLVLTQRGKTSAAQSAGEVGVLLGSLEDLEPTEQEALLRVVVRILAALQRDGRAPLQRVCPACRFFRPNAHPDTARPHHCALADQAFGAAFLRIDCSDFQSAGSP